MSELSNLSATGTHQGEPKLTTQLPTFGTAQVAGPEFTDHHGATLMFRISRPSLYRLAAEGCIKTVLLRQPGKLKGRRLFDVASIRAFFAANVEAPKSAIGGNN
jgi:hypothetical protein